MLYVVGLGPGSKKLMTEEAREVIENTHIIVGYATYVRLIEDMIEGKNLLLPECGARLNVVKKPLRLRQLGKMLQLFLAVMLGSMGWLV